MSMSTVSIQRFLQMIAILHIIVGVCFPWIVDSPLFDHYKQHLYVTFNVHAESSSQLASFLMAIFGPTIASWGVLFLYTVSSGFSRPSPKAWWFMFVACLAWAPYDSIFSLQHGIYSNAIINAIAFWLIVTPMLVVRKHFFTKSIEE